MKDLISNNKYFYKLYYHLYRKHRGIKPNWFQRGTRLYFDGYPRSGNTFLAHFIKNVFTDLKTVHHLHRIAPIKIALSKKIPSYILIRHPKDAITSNYLKHFAMRYKNVPDDVDVDLLEEQSKEYLAYYTFVMSKLDRLEIIPFYTFIDNPETVIQKIANTLNLTYEKERFETVKHTYRGATDKLGSSKPTKYKQRMKDELFKYLESNESYNSSVSVYEQILKKTQ